MKITTRHIDPKTSAPAKKFTNVVVPFRMKAFVMEWEESERGWGTRFDGISLHTSVEEAKKYEREYWSKQPPVTPDEYERPSRSGGWWIEISDPDLISELKEKGSIRLYKHTDAFKELEKMMQETGNWHGCYISVQPK